MVGGGDEDEDGAVVMTIIVVEEDGTADGMAEAVVGLVHHHGLREGDIH